MKMLFKNATAYRIVDNSSLLDLSKLSDYPVAECAPGQVSHVGWQNPFDKESDYKFHDFGATEFRFSTGSGAGSPSPDGFTILCMVTVQKVIKSAAINRETDRIAAGIMKAEDRAVGRKERMQIKEDVIHSALPAALSEEIKTFAYIDWNANLLVISESSANKCDKFTSSLREALGSLKVEPLRSASMPDSVMSAWLNDNSQPGNVRLIGDAVFKNPSDLSQTARVKHIEIDGASVAGIMEDGMVPQELSLEWSLSESSSVDFTVTDSVILKGIKFSDELLDDTEDYEDAEQAYEAAMLINCRTITSVIKGCFELFGGMAE